MSLVISIVQFLSPGSCFDFLFLNHFHVSYSLFYWDRELKQAFYF